MLLTPILALTLAAPPAAPAPVAVARGGKPLMPVVVPADATPRVKGAAAELAAVLGRIVGAKFEVTAGDGTAGLAVGRPADFPALPFKGKWANPGTLEREQYMVRTHGGGAYLLGASELAAEHAVWDFVHRVGYRQFFPGERWEVVPSLPDVSVSADAEENPSYHSRRIWYGFGPWDYAADPYRKWCAKNRAVGGIDLRSGHAYGGFISALKKDFDAHPEWYALVNGQRDIRPQAKLCLSNDALRKRIADHAVETFHKNPGQDSISVDPSDGGGWCECEACKNMGSVSDRAITPANDVAAAVNADKPGRIVGMYAYAYHSPPPAVKVHPKVVVSVATAFIKGGQSLTDIMAGWQKQGATLGVREYYSVSTWDRDLPGHARGGNLEYLTRTIPEFHGKGARYMSAESSDNWGPNGLGYYLAARVMWDVREAKRVDEIVDDFLTRAFGPAKGPMREFYKLLDSSKPHLVADDQLGRMFRALEEARKLAGYDAAVRGRIDELAEYAHYVSLYQRYTAAPTGPARQKAFEEMIRHAYRMRATMLVHTKAIYRDVPGRDKSLTVPTECKWNVPDGKNPWKTSTPFADAEIATLIADGVQRHQPVTLNFEPVKFSDDLVPAAPLGLKDGSAGDLGPGRGVQTYFTHVSKAPAEIELAITGGLIAHYRDRGNVRVTLWKVGGESATGERETLTAEDRTTPPDGKEYTVKLAVKEPGLYKLTVSDGQDRTGVKLKSDLPWSAPALADLSISRFHSRWAQSFYVPKGTKVVGLYADGAGEVLDSAGKVLKKLDEKKPGFYGIDVPPGQDGAAWRVRNAVGRVQLLTVPPYLAPSAKQLLLPAEVVAKDRK